MAVDDRMINIRVDQMLVRRGIDTSKLTVSSTKGTVMIAGLLKARSRNQDVKQGSDLKMLDASLRRIPNLKGVNWHLSNWRREGSTFKKLLVANEASE
ncbi:MAG: hypothetical protein AAB229_05035 [Candidatus Hydrogenedentota bacterium]